MASLVIRNATVSPVTIADVGILMPASTTVTFTNPGTLRDLSGSASLITLVNANTLRVVDGGVDMTAARATVFLKSFWERAGLDDFPQKRLPVGYVAGERMKWASNSTITVGEAGETSVMRDAADSFDITLVGEVTVDITVVGANGRDGGTEAANTWYAVHIIADSRGNNATAGLLSTSATAPTLPSGYDKFRRIGWVRNNGSSNFFNFIQVGRGSNRTVWWNQSKTNFAVLSGGSATVRTTVACGAFVPPTSREIFLGMELSNPGGDAGNDFGIAPAGQMGSVSQFNLPINFQAGVVYTDEHRNSSVRVVANEAQEIAYNVDDPPTVVDLFVVAYKDEL